MEDFNQDRDEEGRPYCLDCGSSDMAYLDQYANGEEWECCECGRVAIYEPEDEEY